MENAKEPAPIKEGEQIKRFDSERALARVDERIKFVEGLRDRLKEGEDYGKHPGYPKPALEKPGAEKIIIALNCGPKIVRGEGGKVVDSKYGLKEYEIVVGLAFRPTGEIIGEGIGYGRAFEKDLLVRDTKT